MSIITAIPIPRSYAASHIMIPIGIRAWYPIMMMPMIIHLGVGPGILVAKILAFMTPANAVMTHANAAMTPATAAARTPATAAARIPAAADPIRLEIC